MGDFLRWGVLGTGNIARQFAAGVSGSRRGKIVAVGSRNESAAREFATAFNVPQSFGTYQQVLKSEAVDIVYIALPNSMHHRWTLAALHEGKHVLCEKPLATDAAEAADMFDAAAGAGRMLIEAFMYRSHPLTLAVADAIQAGAIGQLKMIRTSFCYRTRRVEGNIRFSRELAGGGLMDVGCYCINFSRFFAGAEPNRIDVSGHLHESGIDDLAIGTMAFPNGIVASFTSGMSVQADNTAYLCGSEGYIEIPVPWKPPKENATFTIARATPPRMDAVGQPAPSAPPREQRVINAGYDLYALEADDVAATILDGHAPRITRDDSVGNMRVLDTMRRQMGMM